MLLSQIAFVLGLQVHAESHGKGKFLAAALKNMDGFGIGHAGKGLAQHAAQAFQQALVHETVKKLHIRFTAGQHMLYHMAGEAFAQFHEVREVGKGHFRLDHPEFGGMARGVGVFGPEGGTEGVDPPQAQRQGLGLQLAGYGEIAGAVEKVAVRVFFARRQSGYAEHLARAFAVRTGEHGRVHPGETPPVEKVMHRAPGLGANAEGRPVFVGTRAQMGDAAQKFVSMALFLQGKARRIGQAEDSDAFGPHLPFLTLARRGRQLAAHGQGRAGIGFPQSGIGFSAFVHNALHVGEAGAVIDLHKGKALGVAAGTHPAAEGDVALRLFGVEGVDDECALHGIAPCR